MHALIYARVSTGRQAAKELSIPAQLAACRHYAQQRNWHVVQEFIDAGASARTTERPELQRLLVRCRDADHPVDIVLVHKIDRLARNIADHVAIRAILQERRIKLVSVNENLDNSVSGQLVEHVMAAIAEFHSANLSDEVKKGMRQKVLQGGWPHRPPVGYVVGHREGKNVVEVDPHHEPFVRQAFDLFATGCYSLRALSHRLAADGWLSETGKPRTTTRLRAILTNPFYISRIVWNELEVTGAHPALVTRVVFDQVQQRLRLRQSDRARGGSVPGFPLRGFATCASCRGRMTAERHGAFGYSRLAAQVVRSSRVARFSAAANQSRALERASWRREPTIIRMGLIDCGSGRRCLAK